MVETHVLEVNEHLVLNSSSLVWYLSSGKLLIFNEQAESIKQYLFEIKAGEIFLGAEPEQSSWTMEAIASENSELWAIPLHQWWTEEISAEKLTQLNIWLEKIAMLLQNQLPFPNRDPIVCNINQESISLQLKSGDILQAPQFTLWIEIHEGRLQMLGESKILLDQSWGVVPLYPQVWLQCEENVHLTIFPTPTMVSPIAIQQGLNHSQQALFQYIIKSQLQEEENIRQRLQKKLQQDELILESILDQFAGLFQKQSLNLIGLEQTPLLSAMGKIGRNLGVSISPPKASEDINRLKNPLDGIIRASRLQMRRVVLADNWWQRNNGPLLAYSEGENPVALIPLKNNRYELYDPRSQTSTLVDEKIALNLSGIAYMFYRTFPDQALKLRDILRFGFQSNYSDFGLILLCAMSVSLLNMLTPLLMGQLVNEVIPNAEPDILLQLGTILLSSTIGISLFKLTQGFTILRLENFSDLIIQAAVWDRVLQLPAKFFRSYSTGDLYSRISGVTQIFQQLSSSTLTTLLTGVFAVVNLGLIAWYSWQLAFLGIVVAVISIVITAIHSWFIIKQNRKLLNIEGELSGKIFQLINSIAKLRIAGAEKRGFVYWAKDYQQRIKLKLNTQVTKDSLNLFNTIISPVSTIALFWFAFLAMIPTETSMMTDLSVGNFVAANSAFGMFISNATSLSNTLIGLLDVVNLWQRTQPILLAPLEVDKTKVDPGRLRGKVAIERVNFRYKEDQPLILNDVSIYANPGEFIALVGPSGSGKSTILRLLLGFEIAESGGIYYDDQELFKLNLQAVRRQLGVVLQTSRLQAASIFDNIAGGSLITLDEAWQAARMSGFDEDIAAMPMQMNTVVSEGGTNLSGGQRQRLLIAKGLALKPKILLFDEATSALDNKTQSIVTGSLQQLQVTRIVIAHRLSTIRSADRIYVLNQAKIVQKGTFEELAQQEGLFAELMARQMF